MKTVFVFLLGMALTCLSSCVVRHRHHSHPRSHPPPAARVTINTPPPERAPPPPPRTRQPPPPPPAAVGLSIRVVPTTVKAGNEVEIHLHPAQPSVMLFFNGRPIPKKVSPAGNILTARIPANGSSGHFEVEWNGRRFRSEYVNVIP